MSDELRVGPRHWRQQLRRWATVGPPRAAQHNDAEKHVQTRVQARYRLALEGIPRTVTGSAVPDMKLLASVYLRLAVV